MDVRQLTALAPTAATLVFAPLLMLGASSNAFAQTTILPLGDSITAGKQSYSFPAGQYPESDYRLQSGDPPNDLKSYREHLHDLLAAPSCDADVEWLGSIREPGNRIPAIHQGRSGWRFNDFLAESKLWPNTTGLYPNGDDWKLTRWLDEFDAEIVLLMLGTNDIGRGESTSSTADGLQEMLDKIYAANADSTVFVANLIPIAGWNGTHRYISPYTAMDIAGNVDMYNTLAANIVSQEQANDRDVHLVDVNSDFYLEGPPVSCPAGEGIGVGGDPNNMGLKLCFKQPDTASTFIPDGIHTSLPGARFIAERMFAALQSETNVCGGGGNAGPDTEAPIAFVDTPSGNAQSFGASPTFNGTSTDAGGSGFDRVRVVVRDNDATPARWLNFSTGQFELQNGNLPDRDASLANTTTASTDWSVDIPLTASGDYQLFVIGYDNAGNVLENSSGQKIWTERRFLLNGSSDTQSPETTIVDPALGQAVNGTTTLSGTAVDSGGSGIATVSLAIKRNSDGLWFDFSNGTFSSRLSTVVASLSGSTSSKTWTQSATLPIGNYRLYARAIDNVGNFDTVASGKPRWAKRVFNVSSGDTQPPTAAISSPSASQNISAGTRFAGSASDTGGSGIDRIYVAVKRTTDNKWFQFGSGGFATTLKGVDASLTGSSSNKSWSRGATLPPGNYRLYVRAIDNAGNYATVASGKAAWVTRYFSIDAGT